MDLSEAIRERRSIRRYRKDPVPDALILQCIEAARLAPSWANTQVSRFIVVKEQRIKEALTEALTPHNPAGPAMLDAPCVVCLAAQRGVAGDLTAHYRAW